MSQKFAVARLTLSGEKFEIMVAPNKALDYKLGKNIPTSQILMYESIFRDVGKGEKASEEKMKKIFGTLDVIQIAKTILDKGELPLSTDQRKRLIEEKRKQIITLISRHYADPRTNLPHPPLRIEQALNQVRISIDPFKNAEEQIKELLEEIKELKND